MPRRRIMKFGGSSVGSAESIHKVAKIVAQSRTDLEGDLLVVVSAMQGVTDSLHAAAQMAKAGQREALEDRLSSLRARHKRAAADISGDTPSHLGNQVDDLFTNLEKNLLALADHRTAGPSALDRILCAGEQLSSILVAEALTRRGLQARAVNAADFVITDNRFLNATPDMTQTRQRSRRALLPLLESGLMPVVTGFNGATIAGDPTTLGRGGSDLTAALIGACLDCDEVWIWTDVDGVMSADPRIVPEAHNVDGLSFQEVSELAYFGAKVLHPRTILPLRETGIPLWVKNTFNPEGPATAILPEPTTNGHGIKAVTAIPHLSMITLQGTGMLGVPGIAGRAFAAVGQTGANVLLISQASSEQTLCFSIPSQFTERVVTALEGEFDAELRSRNIDRIFAHEEVTIVTAVGSGIRSTPGVAGDIFSATGSCEINVLAIAQGSSECSLSLVVDSRDGTAAVRAIHSLTLPAREAHPPTRTSRPGSAIQRGVQ